MSQMWQDVVGRALLRQGGSDPMQVDDGAVDEAEEKLSQAKYAVDCANLSADYRAAVGYNLRKNKLESNQHVLHMKNQIDVGLGVCERLMERRLFVVCGPQGQNVAQLQRKVLQDSSQKGFDSTTLEKMHHLGIINIPKMGRLTAPDVQDISDWTYKVLALNPNYNSTQAPRPSPAPNAEDVDLGSVQPKVEEVVEPKETPPSMSLEEFKKKHPTVVFEEQSAEKGVPSDSAPMPIKNLLIQMEKRGFMDTVVTAHKVERPAAVMRGEESDRSG
ncbi:unnamed protein product [Durusdinium trenchii]|uniref:Uncharacterized protein n=1 Tax=Durusdinium trenchii TaxID=1381693 RepID=A0ABP0IAB2_9DINO